MNDTTNTGTTSLDADDRIDALAREAGTALRREPSPRQLARVHRAKRNRQIGQAALGCVAVLAIGGGAFLLLDRDDDAELVPAEPPTTPVVTAPPETAPAITATTAPPTTAVVVPSTAAPATASPPLATANDAASPTPAVAYVVAASADDQQIVDLATAQVVATEPRDHQRYVDAWGVTDPRTESVLGIAYRLDAGEPAGSECGQFPVSVEGAPADELTLPDLASFLAVSDDGRHAITVSTPDCPPGATLDQAAGLAQQIGIFDADDPTQPGITMEAGPTAERIYTGASFSPDGQWMAIRFEQTIDGRAVSGHLAIELATGYVIQHGEDGCTVSAYGQLGELFVGDAAIAVTKSCEDGAYVELVPLSNTGDAPVAWRIPGVDVAAAPSAQVEVWDPSVANIDETTYLVSVVVEGETRFLLGSGAEMEQLPVSGIGVSFRPVDVRSGL